MNTLPISIAVLLAGACCASTNAQCQYSVQLGPPPHECMWGTLRGFSATGMNNIGAWCGYRRECYPEEGEEGMLPVYCPPGGTPQLLPWPSGTGEDGATTTAVNDAGVIVGYFYSRTLLQKGCIWWPDGTVTEIPPAPGAFSCAAQDINNSNVIVGYSGGKPFVLAEGVMSIIPVPRGLWYGFPQSISDAGFMTGYFGTTSQNALAFRWKDGEVMHLEPLPGHPMSIGRGVDDVGVVVGYSRIQWPISQTTPTMWLSDGTPIELELPPGYTEGAARCINNYGVISGEIVGPGLAEARVMWVNGVCNFVNDLTRPGSPTIGSIVDSNAFAQFLTGSGRVLTPIGQSIADLNGDCAVDGSDLVVILTEWGPREWSVADLNSDGVVDGNDLVVVLGQWTGL